MMFLRNNTLVLFFVYFSIFQCITAVSAINTGNSELDTTSADLPTTSPDYDTDDFECGDGNQQSLFCKCGELLLNAAWCEGNIELSRRFTYIPLLPNSTTILYFPNNQLKTVEDRNFFVNVTQLETVDLSYNNITWISAGAFDLMPNLTRVDLSHNPLSNLTALQNVLATPSLEIVDAPHCQFTSFGERFSDDVDVSIVEILNLDFNPMDRVVNLSPLCRLKQLERLSMESNLIKTMTLNCIMTSLEELNLSHNLLSTVPTCGPHDQSLFPELTVLDLKNNGYLRYIITRSLLCLPKLRELYLDDVMTGMVELDLSHLPVLQELHMARGFVRYRLDKSTFNNSAVRFLDFSGNSVDFSMENMVANDTFSPCRNLAHLSLDQNRFSEVSAERFHSLFGHLPLTWLSLKRTELSVVSQRMFFSLTKLELLNLCCNKITYIPDGSFDYLVSLRYLDLSENQIQTISPRTFSDRLRGNLRTLLLYHNPFVCSCDLRWFRAWLRSRSDLFQNYVTIFTYTCSNRPSRVADFVIPDQVCLMSHEVSGYIITFCTTITIILTSFLLLFSYRWHLRLILYEAFRGRDDGVRQQRLLQNNFNYDVFVSYAHQDLPWVRQHLMPELEDRLGLRLCIHERDFIAGNNIADNISESVESSKKVLMVFSKHFVLSQWCQFELAYCLRHVMDFDDVLIIVCVDDVTSREMTPTMMAVLKTTTYIQWAELDDAIRAFWGRVKISLHEILDREHRV